MLTVSSKLAHEDKRDTVQVTGIGSKTHESDPEEVSDDDVEIIQPTTGHYYEKTNLRYSQDKSFGLRSSYQPYKNLKSSNNLELPNQSS